MADIFGTPGDDVLTGTPLDDTITTYEGDDTVDAGDGDDTIIGNENGTGSIDGGAGYDTLRINAENFLGTSYNTSTDLLTIFGGYSVTSIERAEVINSNGDYVQLFQTGTSSDDIIDASSLSFATSAGFNALAGAGNDTLTGADGVSNLLVGGQGADTLIGGDGSGSGYNVFRGGEGVDSYQASNNGSNNRIDFLSGVTQGVVIDLDSKVITNDGFGNAESFTGVINNAASGNTSDTIYGNNDINDIFTNAGNDTLYGRGGNDILNGGIDNDTLNGGAGADTLIGGQGEDTVRYVSSTNGVTVNFVTNVNTGGDAQGDTIFEVENFSGSQFADTFTGNADANYVQSLGGADVVDGGGGDDLLDSGAGYDTVTGGTGNDTHVHETYNTAFEGEITDLEIGDTIRVFGNMDYAWLDNAAFSASGTGEIRYYISSGQTYIEYDRDGDGNADETITLSNGEFSLIGNASNGNNFNITIMPTPINGTSGDDVLNGTPGDDIINGLAGNDIITTFAGNDTVDAGDGDDIIIFDENSTGSIDGGDGFDIVRVVSNSFITPSTNDFFTTIPSVNTNGGPIQLTSIERFERINDTTGQIDWLTQIGDAGDDVLDFSAENFSSQASLQVLTGDGADMVTVGDNVSANIQTGSGDDTIIGGALGGSFSGGAGADTITGNAINGRVDAVSYFRSADGVNINLSTNSATGGDAQGDILSGIEYVYGSLMGDNNLTGDAGDNELVGRWGDDVLNGLDGNDRLIGDYYETGNPTADTLDGGAGDDVLIGGAGMDTLTGGTGADTFEYQLYGDGFSDEITDFEIGDKIQLYESFSENLLLPSFIGTAAFSSTAGELRYENVAGETLLQLDLDGDGAADETLTLSNGEFDLQISASDFNSVSLSITPPPINGTGGDDTLVGTPGDDVINGFAGNDTITTLAGNDDVKGGSGDDLIIIDENGTGTINGQIGFDTVQITRGRLIYSFNDNSNPLLDLIFTNVGQYTLQGIERVEQFDTASGLLETLILNGTNGSDTFDVTTETSTPTQWVILGGSGNDNVTLGSASGTFNIYLGSGSDSYDGGTATGFIQLYSGLGSDTLVGNGTEYLNYGSSNAGVNVDLALNTASGGHAQGDVISNFNNLYGSTFVDTIIGNEQRNVLWGASGDDVIDSGGGNDLIFVSSGTQVLTGGEGADEFNYFSLNTLGSLTSEITDFEAVDQIAVSRATIDGVFKTPTFIGDAAFSNFAGELRYEKVGGETLVQLDIDGDGAVDETLTISNGEFDLEATDINGFSLFLTMVPPPSTSTIVTNANFSGSGSLAGAVDFTNSQAGSDIVTFDTALAGEPININATLLITEDLMIDGDVDNDGVGDIDVFHIASSSSIEINAAGASVSFTDFSLTHTGNTPFTRAVVVSGSGVNLVNDASILASGVNGSTGDRTIAIDVTNNNFMLVNEAGGSIVSTGRIAIQALSLFSGSEVDYVSNIVNHGFIEAPDDGIRLTTGIVTNSGTIRTTHLFDFGGAFGTPGGTSDAISFWGAQNAGYVTPADGQGVVNNLATGIIEGGRSAIFLNGNGTVNNDGLITSEVTAIINNPGSGVGTPAPIAITNTGTIIRDGLNYGLNASDEEVATIMLVGSADASSIEVNNSGDILSPDIAISISGGGATLNNTGFGQILSDTDMAGGDGIAFRGARLDDYLLDGSQVSIGFPSPQPNDVFDNAQGITVNASGEFVTSAGTFPAQGQIEVAYGTGSPNPLLPLVDIGASQANGFLTFQTDANGTVYPASIDVTTTNGSTVTVQYVSGSGFTITDVNGDPAYNVSVGVDFADTITNAGIIEGDILTGLGDDIVTNTGTLIGDISTGQGDDMITAGGNNTIITGGEGDDAIDGGDGVDIAVFSGSLFDYAITESGGVVTVSDLAGSDGTDSLTAIERVTFTEGTFSNVFGTPAADALGATTGADLIFLGSGNDKVNATNGEDYIFGGAGDDQIIGGRDADYIDGGADIDQARYANSNAAVSVDLLGGTAIGGHAEGDTLLNIENLFGSRFDDTLSGDMGDNLIEGFNGNDTLTGNGGTNTLVGGSGDDTFIGGAGADYFNGGSGFGDVIDYSASSAGVQARLGGSQIFSGGDAEGDDFQGIEDLTGSSFNDTLVGNIRANVLTGNAGNDFLNGDKGSDTLLGGDGNDTLIGGFGQDTLDGGDGIDTARYANANSRAVVNLDTGTGTAGHSFGDTLINIENLFGSNFNDVFTGDSGANILNGWNGVDRLTGLGGDDTLIGGAGNDRFIFTDGWDNDTVTDFEDGSDLLDFRSVTGVSGIADLTIADDGSGNAVISFGGDSVTLTGIDIADITAADFLF